MLIDDNNKNAYENVLYYMQRNALQMSANRVSVIHDIYILVHVVMKFPLQFY